MLWENKQNVLPDSAVESGDGVLQYLHDVDPGLRTAPANPAETLRVKKTGHTSDIQSLKIAAPYQQQGTQCRSYVYFFVTSNVIK